MNSKKTPTRDRYCIRLKGRVDPALAEWMDEVTITPLEQGETMLVGEFTDQPALRGFLEQLWNRNFTVLSIERLEGRE